MKRAYSHSAALAEIVKGLRRSKANLGLCVSVLGRGSWDSYEGGLNAYLLFKGGHGPKPRKLDLPDPELARVARLLDLEAQRLQKLRALVEDELRTQRALRESEGS